MKFVFQLAAIIFWLMFLQDCDTYYVPYLVIGICGCLSCYKNSREHREFRKGKEYVAVTGISIIFSLSTVVANFYFTELLIRDKSDLGRGYGMFFIVMVLLGGFFAFFHIFICQMEHIKNFCWREEQHKWKAKNLFLFSVLIISGIDLSVMIAGFYPGVINGDGLNSIQQILSGDYSNHHPFYYTMTIRVFIESGMKWFHDLNAAIALYSMFQIIFMAACFSYIIVTLYQMKIPVKVILACWLWYVIMPFHMLYSFTMWKDIMFGGFVAIFVVSVFRIYKKVGNSVRSDQVFLVIGSVGTCLFRSNGWFVYLLSLLFFVVLFGEDPNRKKMKFLFLAVTILTFILKYPVLEYFNVSQPDTIEYLSVPAQQIARVVRDCDDIREEHRELLNNIVDVERIPETYVWNISDPIKYLVRERGNQGYLVEHKSEFLLLYIEMGMSHLDKYLEAWIDLTKGYWNGGYPYWIWLTEIEENNLGIQQTIFSDNLNGIVQDYAGIYAESPVLRLFLCIGFHVWMIFVMAVICLIRKDKDSLFVMIPFIGIVISLLLFTPVSSEFRYAYAVFCCIPFLLAAPFYQEKF